MSEQRISSTQPRQADLSGYFAQMLAEGRAHLLANRPGSALTAYRQAAYDPTSRAQALNGMAIASDRLGRPDLAQRYFHQALLLEPGNTALLANLERLNANRSNAVEALAALSPGGGDETVREAGVAALETPRSNVRRVSDREIMIFRDQDHSAATAPQDGQVIQSLTNRRHASVAIATRRYPVRVSLAAEPGGISTVRAQPATSAPTRLRVEGNPNALRPRSQQYPVRVALGQPAPIRVIRTDRAAERPAPATAPRPQVVSYPVQVSLDQS
jgi:hypothetical protein